jgi:hypothetical protein
MKSRFITFLLLQKVSLPTAATPINIQARLESAGIWPLNLKIIIEDDFLPPSTTYFPQSKISELTACLRNNGMVLQKMFESAAQCRGERRW